MSYAPFSFVFPTRIIFGPGESGRCAEYVAEMHPKKVFVCTYADVRLPVLDELLTGLEQRNIPYHLHAACTANPRAEQIDAAAALFVEAGCDMVVGVGGGSVIDTCKGVALLAKNPCPQGVWAYVSGEKQAENGAYPIGLIVTIASTGSESNESFVVTDRLGQQKMICSHPAVRPTFSICDPTLTLTLPKKQTAMGAADIFSHVLEQYLHRTKAVDVSDNMSLGILEAVHKWAPVAVECWSMRCRPNTTSPTGRACRPFYRPTYASSPPRTTRGSWIPFASCLGARTRRRVSKISSGA